MVKAYNYKNKISKTILGTALVLGALCLEVTPINAAEKITKSNTKTFAFVSSNGEACSATVTTSLIQNYTTSGSNATYKKRTAHVSMGYVASHTIPKLTVLNPIYVDSNNKTKKSFTWTKNTGSSIVPGGTKVVAFNKYNKTAITYAKTNGYYYSVSYTVGNSSYVLSPYKSKQVKVALKVK